MGFGEESDHTHKPAQFSQIPTLPALIEISLITPPGLDLLVVQTGATGGTVYSAFSALVYCHQIEKTSDK